jgi:hypothetical protein
VPSSAVEPLDRDDYSCNCRSVSSLKPRPAEQQSISRATDTVPTYVIMVLVAGTDTISGVTLAKSSHSKVTTHAEC